MINSKKNILLVISKFPPEYSGPGVRIPELYDWFAKQDQSYNFKVICNGIEQTTNKEFTYKNLKVQRIVADYLNKIFLLLKFIPKNISYFIIYQYEFVKTFLILILSKNYRNINLLHVVGHSGGTAASLLWARIKKVPVFMELVTESALPYQKFLKFFVIRAPVRSYIVTLTQKKKDICSKLSGGNLNIWCRPNPINEEKFNIAFDQKYILRSQLTPFHKDQILITNVAKIIPQKNHILLVKILSFLPEKYVACIAGPLVTEGPLYQRDLEYLKTIKTLIKEYDLEKRVFVVTDFVKMDQFIKISDIYLMPAMNEGFGTPMIEAMACGVPVIANKDETAFQEWVKDGYNGYLCDINNPEEWAEKVIELSNFPPERAEDISRDIHKMAGQSSVYNQYKTIIESLINDKKL